MIKHPMNECSEVNILMSNMDLYPIMINPLSIQKFKKFTKEELIGIQDALILYISIIQWNTLGIDWDITTVTEELGLSEECTEDLLKFMIDEEILNKR